MHTVVDRNPAHAKPVGLDDKSVALVVMPMHVPDPDAIDANDVHEVAAYTEKKHHDENAYKAACLAAEALWATVGHARYTTDATLIATAEQAYALMVMHGLRLQGMVDEWAAPGQWTDGVVSEDGYIRVYNSGREDFTESAYQGEAMNEVKFDSNGIGMKYPW